MKSAASSRRLVKTKDQGRSSTTGEDTGSSSDLAEGRLTLPVRYVTVRRLCVRPPVCPPVCLSLRSTVATAAGGFAAERRRLQQISIDSCGCFVAGTGAGAHQQMRVASC